MKNFQVSSFTSFFMVGIDHTTAEVDVREKFSLGEEQCVNLIKEYKSSGGDGILILSTCNRTEIYAFGNCPRLIISLFCKYSHNSYQLFNAHQNIKQDREAIEHLFQVGGGLQSRILGDFEIIGQIKKSFQRSKKLGAHNAFLERLISSCIQSSKKIKNETELSSGATSVAFVTVQRVKEYLKEKANPKVLLVGTGKIGRTSCENLVNQTGLSDITLINRSPEKAERLAKRFGVKYRDFSHLAEALDAADVVIVATGADKPTILPTHFKTGKFRLILDLSMPRNVHSSLYSRDNFRVIDVDHLNSVAEDNIVKRNAQVPMALQIIQEIADEFYVWLESRKVAPTLKAVRKKMDNWGNKEIQNLVKKFPDLNTEQAEALAQSILNKITGQLARQLRNGEDINGDLRTIHHIFELEK